MSNIDNHIFGDWQTTGLMGKERHCLQCGIIESIYLGIGYSCFGFEGITKAPWPKICPEKCEKPAQSPNKANKS